MANKKNLLKRIGEIRANSVTPEDFEKMWGYTQEAHVDNMMDFIARLEAEEAPAEEKVVVDDKKLREAAVMVRKAVVNRSSARYSAARDKETLRDRLLSNTKAIRMICDANEVNIKMMRKVLGEIKTVLEHAVAEYAGSGKSFDLSNVVIKIGEGEQAVTIRDIGQKGLVMKNVRKGKAGRLKETDEEFLGSINLAALKGGRVEFMQSGEGLPVMMLRGPKKGGKKM